MPTPNETKDSGDSVAPKPKGWVGVDLDGTLAHYEGWNGGAIGAPIPATLDAVKALLAQGVDVRIVTARAASKHRSYAGVPALDLDQVEKIESWCEEHVGKRLPVQFWKDYSMIQLWDDRAIQFAENTGQPVMHSLVLLRNLCSQLYGHLLKGVIPGGLVEALRASCGIPKPEPEPLIVEAKSIPKLTPIPKPHRDIPFERRKSRFA